MASPNLIHVEALVQNDLQKVWTCWTEPEHIVHWNFASDDWHCPSATDDLQPGGKFSWRMEAKDGSFGFDFGGTHNQIVNHQLIKNTLDDGRLVTITFSQTSEGVKVTEEFEAENVNDIELQKNGWQAILNNFKNYVESLN